jgi:hypothetical protein
LDHGGGVDLLQEFQYLKGNLISFNDSLCSRGTEIIRSTPNLEDDPLIKYLDRDIDNEAVPEQDEEEGVQEEDEAK